MGTKSDNQVPPNRSWEAILHAASFPTSSFTSSVKWNSRQVSPSWSKVLYISFTNFTAAKKLNKVGKGFKTSKGEGHGFGLVRMDDIVSRYDGYLSRNSEDGAFTTEILIPQV